MFLSSGDGYFGKILELHPGCQRPLPHSRMKVGFLSRCCSRKGLILRGREHLLVFSICDTKLGAPLKLGRGPQGPNCVASGKSSLHESCEGPLGIPLQSAPGPRSLSGVEARTSGFLSSADMELRVPMEFPQGSQSSSRVETC